MCANAQAERMTSHRNEKGRLEDASLQSGWHVSFGHGYLDSTVAAHAQIPVAEFITEPLMSLSSSSWHYEIWKNCQSTSKVQANALKNLRVELITFNAKLRQWPGHLAEGEG